MTEQSHITLNGLELKVNLGWTEEERKIPQSIWLDIQIFFDNVPLACETDELKDTVCYNQLIHKIKSHLVAREFKLIEKLGKEIYSLLKSLTSANVFICLTKKPAIQALSHVTFKFGDKVF